MRDDQRFEIERAFDLLPHVVGASWATLWFRLHCIRSPSAQDYREKAAEYFKMLDQLNRSFPDGTEFREISEYISWRSNMETERIRAGMNKEVEKRYRRYVDYG